MATKTLKRRAAPEPEAEPEVGVDAAWVFRRHAAFCAIFTDEKRLRIMWFLKSGEQRVSDIAEHLGISAQNTSQHLRVMRSRGALRYRREGRAAYYRIANQKFIEGAGLIREGVLEELQRIGERAGTEFED